MIAKKITLIPLTIFLILSCSKSSEIEQKKIENEKIYNGKKILYVDSYHENYPANTLTRNAFKKIVEKKGIDVVYSYFDAKRQKEEQGYINKAQELLEFISEYKPDLIVAADDVANKYFVSKYLLGSEIPVIFVGVNWDAAKYNYPASNITGQLEVELIIELIDMLKQYTEGERIGILTGNTHTDRTSISYYKDILGVNFKEKVLVDDFKTWKEEFIRLQDSLDILIVRHNAGINNWNKDEAIDFIRKYTKIPTGSISHVMNGYVLLTFPKMNAEWGRYAGDTALKILSGTSPSEIEISKNRESKIYINTTLTRKLKILFPQELLERSVLVSEKRKVLYVNSYHKGYVWSDDIEKGLNEAIKKDEISKNIVLKTVRMDTKRNTDIDFIKNEALKIKDLIESWNPELIITSDDNAAKFLIQPYYSDSEIPVIFCGLNWDASVYGFPTKNVTGMVEVAPVKELLAKLQEYTKGKKIGYLGADNLSESKEINHYKNILRINFEYGKLVKDFESWKKEFLYLQDRVDILILVSFVGITDWNQEEAENFVLENTKIISGTSTKHVSPLAVMSFIRIAEEQGWWSGKMAIDVLNGKPISDIHITTNKNSSVVINMELCRKLNIYLDQNFINNAVILGEGSEI